jgi:acetyl-CoA C-acetyltransferase
MENLWLSLKKIEEGDMAQKVAIIGVGQTKYEEAKRRDGLADVIFEAASKALDDAGLKRDDMDSVVMAAHDQIDGRSISSMLTAIPAGAYLKDETRVCEDGALAVALALVRLLTGEFNTSLVVSWAKLSEGNFDLITNLNFDPLYHRPFGLSYVTAHAIQAMRYMSRYGITEAQAAKVVAKNRSNALNNPLAHLQKGVTVDEVLKSKLLSWPLKELDLPPHSDGACALVLANEEWAKKARGGCVWIKGIGWNNDTYYIGDKELGELPSLAQAAKGAYQMAGIDNPLEQIDVAEVHDATSFHELMAYEALGFCKPGEGGRFIDDGMPAMSGKLPVNPSGGVLSSHPYTAVGLIRVAEAALQVMGRAQGHQVSGVKTALAHGMSGMCGQVNCVLVLSK